MKLPIRIAVSISSREKALVFVIGLALLYAGFDLFFYGPEGREEQKLQQELQAMDGKIQESYGAVTSPGALAREIKMLERKLRFCEEVLDKQPPPGRQLEQLALLCRDLDVEIISLRPREAALTGSGFKQLFISMDVKCDFQTLAVCLAGIRRLPWFSIVESLDVQRAEEPSGALKATLVLRSFVTPGRGGPQGRQSQ